MFEGEVGPSVPCEASPALVSVRNEYEQSLTDAPGTDGEIRLRCVVIVCETSNGRAGISTMSLQHGNLTNGFHCMISNWMS
jgi:hypothetical protein